MTRLLTWLLDGDIPTYQLVLGFVVGLCLGIKATLFALVLHSRSARRC